MKHRLRNHLHINSLLLRSSKCDLASWFCFFSVLRGSGFPDVFHPPDASPCGSWTHLQGPATGGGPESFDLVIGPRTKRDVLGEALSNRLLERGFCVLRLVQREDDRSQVHKMMQQFDSDGRLCRLATEVEEGYLGKGGRGKVMWLDPEDPSVPHNSALRRNDANITSLAEILQPFAEDVLGAPIAERTPALACMSMTDAEEAVYEHPTASDTIIEEFYGNWARSVLRVVHFMGPGECKVELTAKEDAPLSKVEESYEITAGPNTILLVRQDTFDFWCDEPEDESDAFWLQAFLLRAGPSWTLGDLIDGDLSLLVSRGDGPPPPSGSEVVAVVALSLQACGKMTDHHKEWAAYTAGCDAQLEMPITRFEYLPYYSDEVDMPMGTTFVKHFSVQDGVELFDNKAFEISNMEAECMDPMFRQVMEATRFGGRTSTSGETTCSTSVLVGQTPKNGVVAGLANSKSTHASVSVGLDKQETPASVSAQKWGALGLRVLGREWTQMPVATSVATNNQLAIVANRFNYVFNLKGEPWEGGSYACDTACSSSLVATHLGKVNLLEQRWDPLEWHLGMGTGLTLTVGSFIHGCAAHMLSPGGRCFTFNATANGYNRGDGTAGFIIKNGTFENERLAYFRGSQIGQDGRSASMSAPNGPAQEKCVWGALREAKMRPPESTVWECHGTGTSLGDPIEVGAIRKVQIKEPRAEPLLIASSKSNLGHLEGSAAAIAMNKCILIVMHAMALPTQHVKTLNPHLDHAAFDAIYTTEHTVYKYAQGHCQASAERCHASRVCRLSRPVAATAALPQVSSFGVGGTNGHAIFWGEKAQPDVDFRRVFLKKIMRATPPIVTEGTTDPALWDYRGLDYKANMGDSYKVCLEKDPLTGEETVTFEKEQVKEDPAEFYGTTGNHNDWDVDRMQEGNVRSA
ncbi:Highly reducing polyketide synthase srdA (HRPKS sdrA) (Polyketide synthase gene cluster 6 protein pks-6) (Sordarial biosynthesis cluster protein srdA) [Durusdinium trenchii]|uniref:Highly reducing polyketide synthase srdA (HRPKS sdrA) (Polyketide synthase gene cluster 6 protein pks-6) (Sordarial biosynthesis cluster protein srdA) n=1 Tax=Durusdinium trenchii TaxID=1381693 RepID=A0ABP0RWP6_9DINO